MDKSSTVVVDGDDQIGTSSVATTVTKAGAAGQRGDAKVKFNNNVSAVTTVPTESTNHQQSNQQCLDIPPEIQFLVREHAKTVSVVNQLSNRLDRLEMTVSKLMNQQQQQQTSPTQASTKLSTTAVQSDDSGGEYSRTTNGTSRSDNDDDELLSLLDQIAKCSRTIRETQQAQLSHQSALLNCVTGRPHPTAVGVGGGAAGSSSVVGVVPHHGLFVDNFSLIGGSPTTTAGYLRQQPPPLPQQPPPPLVTNNNHHQLYSALLDENVDRFLLTLQQKLAMPVNIDDQLSTTGLLGLSSVDPINAGTTTMATVGQTIPMPGSSNGLSHQGPTVHELLAARERVAEAASAQQHHQQVLMAAAQWQNLVRRREREEVASQIQLADQWLSAHLKKSSPKQ